MAVQEQPDMIHYELGMIKDIVCEFVEDLENGVCYKKVQYCKANSTVLHLSLYGSLQNPVSSREKMDYNKSFKLPEVVVSSPSLRNDLRISGRSRISSPAAAITLGSASVGSPGLPDKSPLFLELCSSNLLGVLPIFWTIHFLQV